MSGGHLAAVLGVFQKLIASKAHDHEGFFILNTLVEYLSPASYEQYLPTIWQLLFTRCGGVRAGQRVGQLGKGAEGRTGRQVAEGRAARQGGGAEGRAAEQGGRE